MKGAMKDEKYGNLLQLVTFFCVQGISCLRIFGDCLWHRNILINTNLGSVKKLLAKFTKQLCSVMTRLLMVCKVFCIFANYCLNDICTRDCLNMQPPYILKRSIHQKNSTSWSVLSFRDPSNEGRNRIPDLHVTALNRFHSATVFGPVGVYDVCITVNESIWHSYYDI